MTIKFEDWKKLDIRVGEIKEVNDHPNANKLYVMKVDIGDEVRNIVAGIKQNYNKEELVGKKIIVFCNLEPATFRGVKSEAMLLAAADKDIPIVLITQEKEIKSEAKVE